MWRNQAHYIRSWRILPDFWGVARFAAISIQAIALSSSNQVKDVAIKCHYDFATFWTFLGSRSVLANLLYNATFTHNIYSQFNTIALIFAYTADDTNITHNYCPRMGFTLWSNFTITCSRICSPEKEDSWLLELNLYNESLNPRRIGENRETIEFEKKTGVTLSESSNNTDDSCNGEVIEYALTIENTRTAINGLAVTCGARKIVNDQITMASNSTVLYLSKTS